MARSLEAVEYKGGLYRIADSFSFRTIVALLAQHKILTAVTSNGRAIRYGVQRIPKVVTGPGHTVSYYALEAWGALYHRRQQAQGGGVVLPADIPPT